MPFRHPQPQLEILLRDHRNGVAGQHDGTDGHQLLQHAPVGGSKHLPLIELLLDHRALGGPRPQPVFGDVERGPRLVELDARKRAALHQSLGSGKIDLRLVRLRLQGVDLRIQRLHLQRELFVADRRDRLAARDRVAFPDIELDDGAADAPARRHHADALDGGEHRLLVGDRPRGDGEGFRVGRCARATRAATAKLNRYQSHASIGPPSCHTGRAAAFADISSKSSAATLTCLKASRPARS